MRQPSSEELLRVLREYMRLHKDALAFHYTYHVSLCGSLDEMKLVAYNTEHEVYHAATISYEAAYASSSFGEVYGKAITSLLEAMQEQEKYYLRGS